MITIEHRYPGIPEKIPVIGTVCPMDSVELLAKSDLNKVTMNETTSCVAEMTAPALFSHPSSRRRVLIVEDEALIAMDLKGRLENLGYEVPGIAASADAALTLASRHTPDLILMDIRLQGARDGIEAAAEVRRLLDIPVIFLTSHSDVETIERARLAEPFGYIAKPFGFVNFRALIEIALQKHGTERSLRKSVRWFSDLEKRRLMRLIDEPTPGPHQMAAKAS
jgi:CheY-like chemotaxis protein